MIPKYPKEIGFPRWERRAAYWQAVARRAVEAMESISRNTCCKKCREAALVAGIALRDIGELPKEGE